MSLRILTMTSLFPNEAMPRHGIFVRERLRQLTSTRPVTALVAAPVPWFPSRHPKWGRYAGFAAVPERETMDGMHVHHPRFPTVPRLGNVFNPWSMAITVRRLLDRLNDREFDLIDAHYAFPDGVAAILLAGWLDKPVVVTVRGSDINLLPAEPAARWWLRRTLKRCDGVIAVSQALADGVEKLEPSLSDRIHVLRNGVDCARFCVRNDREAVRNELGWHRPTVLSVGNLVPLKGHDLVIAALADLPQVHLTIVGAGPEEQSLRNLAERSGVGSRVTFLGCVEQARLVDLYNAANVTVLASSSEGMPNVVLESLACGTPVVAARVGGVPEVLNSPRAGTVVATRSPGAFSRAIAAILADPPPARLVSAHAASFGWERTSEGIHRVFTSVAGNRNGHGAVGCLRS